MRDHIEAHRTPKNFPLHFFSLTYIATGDRVTIIF